MPCPVGQVQAPVWTDGVWRRVRKGNHKEEGKEQEEDSASVRCRKEALNILKM